MRTSDSPPTHTGSVASESSAAPLAASAAPSASATGSGEHRLSDLVDPLNVIVGFASMLADVGGDLSPEVRHRYAVRVRDAAEALQRSMAARREPPDDSTVERNEDWVSSGTFRVAARASESVESEQSEEPAPLPTVAQDSVTRARVFLVDADAGSRELLAEYLGGRGYELVMVGSGREALSRAAQCPPDLVVLDPRLPSEKGAGEHGASEDGMALARALTATSPSRFVPLVLVVARIDEEARERAIDSGAYQLVKKPVNRHELRARVKGLLELRAHREEIAVQSEQRRRLQRFKNEATAMLVQELRSPLTAMLMNLDFAVDELPARTDLHGIRLALTESRAAGTKLRRSVANLLDAARGDDGRLVPRRATVDADALLQQVVVDHAADAHARRVTLTSTGELVGSIDADGDLLGRVLGSLVEHTLRHTESGGLIELTITRHGPTPRVQLVVTNGTTTTAALASPPSEDPPRPTTARAGRLHGFGLYFCHVAIEAHGGRLESTGDSSNPMCFTIELPQ